jgi:hypothetical protein
MKYFFGFLISILLLFLLIFLLVGRGGQSAPQAQRKMSDFANSSSSVSLTTMGIINYHKQHRQIRITVEQDNVTYELISGYSNNVIQTKKYPNTSDAYATFLQALGLAGYLNGKNEKALADYRGYCPLGQTYVYNLQDNGDQVQQLWSTNCGGTKTFYGNPTLTQTLFQNQVPDYQTLTQNVQLQ